MRLPLLIFALAACTESDQERLDRYLEDAEAVCAQASSYGIPADRAEQAVSCMNDALESGALVWASREWLDSWGFVDRTYLFTVDHQVKIFDSHPNGSDGDPNPWAHERATCPGHFRVGERSWPNYAWLSWDGCP
jgi:hypothetical protein